MTEYKNKSYNETKTILSKNISEIEFLFAIRHTIDQLLLKRIITLGGKSRLLANGGNESKFFELYFINVKLQVPIMIKFSVLWCLL